MKESMQLLKDVYKYLDEYATGFPEDERDWSEYKLYEALKSFYEKQGIDIDKTIKAEREKELGFEIKGLTERSVDINMDRMLAKAAVWSTI